MVTFTPTYIEALSQAPNTDVAISAQYIADASQWDNLGFDSYRMWGVFKGNVQVALYRWMPQVGFYCSSSEKGIGQHVIALQLLLAESPASFKQGVAPMFVKTALTSPFDSPPEDQRGEIERGLGHLDQWITNLMRYGLGETHVRTEAFWLEIAERMAAAYMPTIAQTLRDVPTLFSSNDDWVEPVLHRLGRLYLILRSFERFDEQPLETQSDLRDVLDWPMTADELDVAPIQDTWIVIGRIQRTLNAEVPEVQVWVYGTESKRIAHLRQVGFRQVQPAFHVAVGTSLSGSVVFHPTKGSQRAVMTAGNELEAEDVVQMTGITMEDAVADFKKMLSANPWLPHTAIILDDVYPTRFDQSWTLRYEDGRFLPIHPDFEHKWVLYAMSSGEPLQVVALWDGQYLSPLSALQDDQFVDMNSILKYK